MEAREFREEDSDVLKHIVIKKCIAASLKNVLRWLIIWHLEAYPRTLWEGRENIVGSPAYFLTGEVSEDWRVTCNMPLVKKHCRNKPG